MEFGRKPKGTPADWLMNRKTATAEDLSNDIWLRIDRVNRMLEKYGHGDFIHNMPILFAMYYYTVVTVMQIPEEPTGMELQRIYRNNIKDLDDECLIEDEDGTKMIEDFHAACRNMAEKYVEEKKTQGDAFNPVSVIITEAAKLLELPYQDIHIELAQHLADFAVSYRVGDPAKKYPLR